MSDLVEVILSMVRKKGTCRIEEIQETFNLTRETQNSIIDFLVEYGFLEWDKRKRYIRLSKPSRKFFEEIER